MVLIDRYLLGFRTMFLNETMGQFGLNLLLLKLKTENTVVK